VESGLSKRQWQAVISFPRNSHAFFCELHFRTVNTHIVSLVVTPGICPGPPPPTSPPLSDLTSVVHSFPSSSCSSTLTHSSSCRWAHCRLKPTTRVLLFHSTSRIRFFRITCSLSTSSMRARHRSRGRQGHQSRPYQEPLDVPRAHRPQ